MRFHTQILSCHIFTFILIVHQYPFSKRTATSVLQHIHTFLIYEDQKYVQKENRAILENMQVLCFD